MSKFCAALPNSNLGTHTYNTQQGLTWEWVMPFGHHRPEKRIQRWFLCPLCVCAHVCARASTRTCMHAHTHAGVFCLQSTSLAPREGPLRDCVSFRFLLHSLVSCTTQKFGCCCIHCLHSSTLNYALMNLDSLRFLSLLCCDLHRLSFLLRTIRSMRWALICSSLRKHTLIWSSTGYIQNGFAKHSGATVAILPVVTCEPHLFE